MFKNLKIEKRNTKIFIIKIKNKITKIPHSFNSWKEIQKERTVIKEVQKDPVFAPHLLEYKYILGFPIIARLSPIKEVNNKMVEKYFQIAFEDSEKWKNKPLKYLLDSEFFLDFVLKNLPNSHRYFLKFLDIIELPQSSAHGDFHPKNILVKGNKLYFIDWSRYRQNSSRYFDLLDFYIYLKGKKYESWMQVWSREYNQIPDAILGIKLPEEYFLAYGVWRAAEELKKFTAENALDKYKYKKYIKFLSVLAEKINV